MRTVIFLTILCGLCGCIAKSSHVAEGDKITARLAGSVAAHFPEDAGLAYVTMDAQEHAEKNPSALPPVGDAMGVVTKALSGDWVGAGMALVATLTAAYGVHQKRKAGEYRQERDQNWELAKTTTDLPPDEAKKVLADYKRNMKKHA